MPRTTRREIRANIARCVRAQRRALDLTQAELGACLGLTQQQVHRLESSQHAISADRLAQIAEALGIHDMNVFFAPTSAKSNFHGHTQVAAASP